jgi:putative ABC transport system permease protein
VVLLSERLWRDRFQADPQIIGKNLTLTGRSFQVIGVTPVQNGELSPIDIFAPLNQDPDWQHLKSDRSSHAFACFGRLKENVTPQQAQAELEVVSKNLAVQYPDTHAALTVRVVPLLTSIVAGYASTLWILAGAVVLLLAIACANIANLQFTRGLERRKELAFPVALGATRTDLVKQMFFENALLTFIGGCLGVLIADWSIRGLKVFGPQNMPRLQDVQLDGVGLVFALGATLLTSIASGLLPALGLSRTNVVLRAEARKGYTHQLRHSVLLICQVALSLVLLFGAALMARSFQAIQNIPLGFNPKNLLTADIYLPRSRYPTQSQCKAFFDSLQAKLKNQPGIKSVGMDDDLPFEFGARNMGPFGVAGRAQPDKAHRPRTEIELVSPDYFRTLEINLLKGREFDAHDQYDDNRVVIISQTVADRFSQSRPDR